MSLHMSQVLSHEIHAYRFCTSLVMSRILLDASFRLLTLVRISSRFLSSLRSNSHIISRMVLSALKKSPRSEITFSSRSGDVFSLHSFSKDRNVSLRDYLSCRALFKTCFATRVHSFLRSRMSHALFADSFARSTSFIYSAVETADSKLFEAMRSRTCVRVRQNMRIVFFVCE